MFNVTEAAKAELKNRLVPEGEHQFIRMEMRKSCYMRLRLRLEESKRSSDSEFNMDGMHFIIDNGECHYFNHKTLDYIADHTGFKQFEIV